MPSSSRQYRSRPRQHILPRRDAPLRRRASPSLLVAVGALLCPPELLRPVLNRRPARRAACPDIVQRGDKAALTQTTRRCGKLLDLRKWRGQRHSFPRRRAGGESFILFRHIVKERANSLSSEFTGSRADSVRRTASSPSGSPCPPVSPRRSRRPPLPRYGKWASGSSTVSSMARAREQLCDHRDLVLRHLSQLGLRVNWEKSKLSPAQRISFLGVELDSVSMTARLTEERAQSVLNCLSSFRGRTVVPLKRFQRLLGHMASAAAVTPLGLLHMRPLQHWLHSRVPRWAWRCGALRVKITQEWRCSFSPWTDLAFLRAGVPLEQVSRHVVVTTDASSVAWGATCNGQAASGLWTGPRLLWHINCLELLAVHLALRQFRPLLLSKHVLVRTDNTAAVSYINRMGGIRPRRMSQLARHLLLWSHTRLKSLRAVHISGELNRAADALS